ncbi:MAG: sigma 54-interacting transcriptional regulator [Desulfocapsaceae bacterium]|nr:sigma 54-interacting transcriptional regulator [Desulfocapsaceae bacterium]
MNKHYDIPLLLEGIPHATMILDDSFCVVHMNRLMEAITGYTREDVTGIHGELVVRSNAGNSKGQLYSKVLKTGKAESVAGDLINRSRRKIPIQYTVSALDGIDGSRCGLLVVAEDTSATDAENQQGILSSETTELIGYSPKMQEVFNLVPLMAHTDASVMITGETGTGKDKIAEIIHKSSSRARYPFIKVNCGALPSGLLESELFGHVKGAFTGATRNKPGMFELANKGTLFLTEIGDMPLPLQVKLLSVLDDNAFLPVGGEQKLEVDVRVIAATHRPLREQIRKQEFREDLFYRLHVLYLHLPPLRERGEDVRYLVDYFFKKFTSSLGKSIVGFTPEAMETLLQYNYPGNIRELKNIVEFSVNMCKDKHIDKDVLPSYIFEPQKIAEEPPGGDQRKQEKTETIPRYSEETRTDDKDSWEEIERSMIIDKLKEFGGNRTKSAAALGWGRMKLWRKMKHYKLS